MGFSHTRLLGGEMLPLAQRGTSQARSRLARPRSYSRVSLDSGGFGSGSAAVDIKANACMRRVGREDA